MDAKPMGPSTPYKEAAPRAAHGRLVGAPAGAAQGRPVITLPGNEEVSHGPDSAEIQGHKAEQHNHLSGWWCCTGQTLQPGSMHQCNASACSGFIDAATEPMRTCSITSSFPVRSLEAYNTTGGGYGRAYGMVDCKHTLHDAAAMLLRVTSLVRPQYVKLGIDMPS
jgi:hypothetical protein